MNPELHFPKTEKEPSASKKKTLTESDIEDLARNFSKNEKEIEGFVEFIDNKFKKMSRRDFLKAAIGGIGAAASVSYCYKYFKENADKLWTEYQQLEKKKEQIEPEYKIVYSKEMTELYEKVENLPNKEIKYKSLDEALKDVSELFKHAEFIKNSKKNNLEWLVNELNRRDLDAILFGEYHGPKSNAVNLVKILESLQLKSNKKIAKIALEYVDFVDQRDVDLTEKFNKKEISIDDFYHASSHFKTDFRTDIRPILEFAWKNNIPITGLEDKRNFSGEETGLKRFRNMSQRVGDLLKDKKGEEIIVTFSGLSHTTRKNLSEKAIHEEERAIRGEKYDTSKEKDYTFKEHLEKIGFSAVAINLEDWKFIHTKDNWNLGTNYYLLKKGDDEIFYNYCQKRWNNYKTTEKETFSIENEEGIYTVVTPCKVPETSPNLNVLKAIKKTPILKNLVDKKDVFFLPFYKDPENPYLTKIFSPRYLKTHATKFIDIAVKIADIDFETGKVRKLYLPEQAKDKRD